MRDGKWHRTVADEPAFTRDEQSLCGLTFRPLNVTHGEKPNYVNPRAFCAHCLRHPDA
ncbi:MAG TPA: hypothetical protein VJ598_06935 [Albitalea sp.]|nr:hypothetical protein [Albitalea sp.]